jgi:predicted RNase H-like nuclease (RuvC/YqgF family)
MLQLMDLAKENAALKRELERMRREAKALRVRLEEDIAPTDQSPWSRPSMSGTDE